ncbi:hypothetical protein GCM10011508_19220 [Flavobacterium lutivivi]|nr:hypothetical protein GCM10011508_19220 [Flavobacterium lutivivi]
MKDSKSALYLFVSASLVVIISSVFKYENIVMLAKPMIIPSAFFYYLQTKKTALNISIASIFVSFFVGDMIILVLGDAAIRIILLTFLVGYLILLKTIVEDLIRIEFNFSSLLYVFILMILLAGILYFILDLPITQIIDNYWIFMIYGVVLITLVLLATYYYVSNQNINSFNLLIATLAMLLSDLFYCLYNYVMKSSILDAMNLFTQFLSYYLLIKYYNSRIVTNKVKLII